MATRAKQGGVESRRRATDRFRIHSGALGPVPKCEMEIRPLTLFVGRQGTGKSLISQVLYLFEELPFLIYYASAQRGSPQKSSEELFRWVLDRLRSSERAFATFANKNVHISWERASGYEWPPQTPHALEFRAYKATRQVTVRGATGKFLDQLRKAVADKRSTVLHHAVFFPTERMVISQLRSAMGAQMLALPLTYTLFSHWLDDRAALEAARWANGQPDTPDGRLLDKLGREALGGSARKHGDQWKWEFKPGRTREQFDLDMASSGQRSNWSLPYIGRTLFSLRATGDVAEELTLFVEEPEIHLHPQAQRDMVKMLALLVNRGFRVVVTTHSLTVLYTLNNLIQASLLQEDEADGVPEPEFRLKPTQVSVYAFEAGAAPRQLVDIKKAFIDERELGAVADDLAAELNRIGARLAEEE